MRRVLATASVLFAFATCGRAALAACVEPPAKTLTIEAGAAVDTVTHNANWYEQSLTVVSRDGNRSTVYGRAAADQRFGANDPSYEIGAYSALGPHIIGNVDGAWSPTHIILPATAESGGVDWRTSAGYGYQTQYTQRNYTTQNAGIVGIGADRYKGVNRYAVGMNFAGLTGVPGIAVTMRGTFARYFTCDEEAFNVSGGRDVESTGVRGLVAVYQSISFDANLVHWFSQRFAANVGTGWYILNGAYNRFEMRMALRERL